MSFATCRITVGDESAVGEARRSASELARSLGGDEEFAGRASIIASEAARNLARHGGGGEILLRKLRPCEGAGLDMLALDRGPGMKSVAECLRDGYSSGGTAGQGLGAIRRIADAFEIFSSAGRGTALWCRLQLKDGRCAHRGLTLGAANVALAGEEVCGDAWEIAPSADSFRFIVADGLGHGPFAADASCEALSTFRRDEGKELPELMEKMHANLHHTRGAAISMVALRPSRGEATACGIGNVAMRLVGEAKNQHLISNRGTVGGNLRPPQEYPYQYEPGSLLILHSDGLSTQWSLAEYPGLYSRHPGLIAGVLYRDFHRERDDATVVVARYVPS